MPCIKPILIWEEEHRLRVFENRVLKIVFGQGLSRRGLHKIA
jgi:hypothetical protein